MLFFIILLGRRRVKESFFFVCLFVCCFVFCLFVFFYVLGGGECGGERWGRAVNGHFLWGIK